MCVLCEGSPQACAKLTQLPGSTETTREATEAVCYWRQHALIPFDLANREDNKYRIST